MTTDTDTGAATYELDPADPVAGITEEMIQRFERDGVMMLRQALDPQWIMLLEMGFNMVLADAGMAKYTFFEGSSGEFQETVPQLRLLLRDQAPPLRLPHQAHPRPLHALGERLVLLRRVLHQERGRGGAHALAPGHALLPLRGLAVLVDVDLARPAPARGVPGVRRGQPPGDDVRRLQPLEARRPVERLLRRGAADPAGHPGGFARTTRSPRGT